MVAFMLVDIVNQSSPELALCRVLWPAYLFYGLVYTDFGCENKICT